MRDRASVIAATGHRPNKVGGYGVEAQGRLVSIARGYLQREKPDRVISGMAQGWDTAWALAALNLDIPLTAAVPFEDQTFVWPAEAQRRWRRILDRAQRVVVVSPGPYAAWKMQRRNEWMVDNCDQVCALWDGSNCGSGTANCVKYAKSIGRPVENIWYDYIKYIT